ncbi:hypothetical protein HanXRQr2_Chr02g0073171 [Helianthus annuus]|uniref:Uncharacterized protein n=1 Tax=Helianthus annuus TaxID=4232 RepID=A0A9K3JPQ8_HELAN|nr:hypothetical protein HanXRQr2_Chr02g0073171 [Helianthus annuus]KAJ0892137.1 hypothetical protein HanPSC8_Chr09g0362321 [Helianthus annuus]
MHLQSSHNQADTCPSYLNRLYAATRQPSRYKYKPSRFALDLSRFSMPPTPKPFHLNL